MSRKQIVFLGSKAIGAFCLKHLLENRDKYQVEIIAAVTKPNAGLDDTETVENLCTRYQVPTFDSVRDIPQTNIILSVQHHEILKQEDINKADELAVNLHMAPLPEYRGCNQFSFAIIDGRKSFGTTLHKITTGIDEGDIIAERRFPIAGDIWVEDLYELTLKESKLLFEEQAKAIISGSYQTVAQESLLEERGTSYHFRKDINKLKIIDENWPADKKLLHVRATFKRGFEPPFSIADGVKKYYDKKSFL